MFDAVETVKGMVGVDARQILTKLPKHTLLSVGPLLPLPTAASSGPMSAGRGKPHPEGDARHAANTRTRAAPTTPWPTIKILGVSTRSMHEARLQR
jgi:hypothetical protein